MSVRKGMYVRCFHDDGRGGDYVYGVAVTNGDRRPRVRWENGNEQVVPVRCLEIVTGDIPADASHRLREWEKNHEV